MFGGEIAMLRDNSRNQEKPVMKVVMALVVMTITAGIAGCGGSGATADPTPSPTPNRAPTTLAFTSRRALDGSDAAISNRNRNIWVMNADGSGQTPLTKLTTIFNTNILESFNPVWSPDGSKIAFVSNRPADGIITNQTNFTPNIWVMNADGSNQTALTTLNAFLAASVDPVWSPDGKKIAFASKRALDGSDALNIHATQNVWVMNADGSSPTPLTRLTANMASFVDASPVWSPDGSKIAFASPRALDGTDAANSNSAANLWVMNADGSNPIPLTRLTVCFNCSSSIFTPVWSPDGSKIMFVSERALDGSNAFNAPNGTQNVWVVSANGSSPAPLTRLTGELTDCLNPAWSPDGSKIAFHTRRALNGSDFIGFNATDNVWGMNADGSNQAALTKLTASMPNSLNPNPLWSRDGSKIVLVLSASLDGTDFPNLNSTPNIWVMNADGSGVAPLTKLTAAGAGSETPTHP
jgi:Tol biopolymer transport system component